MQFFTDDKFILIFLLIKESTLYYYKGETLQENKRTYFNVANKENLSANDVIFIESRSWYLTYVCVRLNMSLVFNLVYVFSENNILWTYTRFKNTSIERNCHFCKSVLPHTISGVYSFRTIRQERQETNYY